MKFEEFGEIVQESKPKFEEFGEVIDEKPQPSKTRSLLSAYPKGLIKAQNVNPFPQGFAVPQELVNRVTEQVLPTRKGAAEEILETAGNITPYVATGPESIGAKALQVGSAALSKQIAKESGLGETGQAIAEFLGFGGPQLAKGIGKKVAEKIKRPVQKMASGLTQPKAVEAKKPKLGTITKIQQDKAIEKLNKEAAELTKSSIEKNVPLAKQINEGFDFESKFQKGFSDIEKSAAKANPEIDITPVSDLFAENRKKYSGIPNLHQDAKKIVAEMRGFGNRPQTGLRNLMKIFRSNNQKKKHIYETAHLTGRQKEYVGFLDDYNRSIVDSIKKTLPQDSPWLKQFLETNKDYGNYQKAQKTIQSLREAFNENPTMKRIERLSDDVKAQKKLAISMGKEGSAEVIQISKDLKLAKEALKKIPKKEWGKWDAAFSLGILVPLIGKPIGGLKSIQAAKAGYGWLLSTPARRKATESALKAIAKNDLEAYKKATMLLIKDVKKEED